MAGAAAQSGSGLPGLDDLDVKGRRVLVRVDWNVPLDPSGNVADDFRVRESLGTLRRLLDRGAALVIASHLGRPDGQRDPKASLAPVARTAAALLGREVRFPGATAPEPAAIDAARALRPGDVLLLENLRFDPGETKDDAGFARALAALADAYVDDAFGAAHRAHASVHAVARLLPAAAGDLLLREVRSLERLLGDPARPFVALLGGAKVSDKIGVVRSLLPKLDAIVVGGGMALTLLAARGARVGRSKIEKDKLDVARALLAEAEARGVPVDLPEDHLVAKAIDDPAGYDVVAGDPPDDRMALDIGPRATARFIERLRGARTVVWNGPVGVAERPPYHLGTLALGWFLAHGPGPRETVACGGDTAAAARSLGFAEALAHVSTGGGAALELLEGKELPGVAALRAGAGAGAAKP